MNYLHRAWAEIDLDALVHNFNLVRSLTDAKIFSVVKANAYGHGASKLAPLYQQMGADWFAVSNIEEALQLRRFGVTRPVLILGYTPAACAEILAREHFSQCVYSAEYGRQLSAAAVADVRTWHRPAERIPQAFRQPWRRRSKR